MPRFVPRPTNSNDPLTAETPSELRRMIGEIDPRIVRQHRRVEKIILEQEGPRDEMEALLADMIKTRDMMQAQLERLERDERA